MSVLLRLLKVTFTPEDDFVHNGENSILAHDQYRVVLRTGVVLVNGICKADFHFWYQTVDGRWAHKNGENPPALLPWGVTPNTPLSGGWDLTVESNFVSDFYKSDIYCYIVTLS